ncbi:zinc finger protein 845-like [Eupeodes corollae]|uniref:zinc finger protein 845-like n=1 Tax=Eupeodes corollae TaxID=290404 RepID=UPI0024927DC6|nr:zinc finger protein 845-like [Eupeodes corollae]
MAGELTQIGFSNLVKDGSCSFTDWPDDDIDNESHINGVIMTEDMIKQEPELVVDLNNPDEEHKIRSFLEKTIVDDEERQQLNWLTCLVCDERFLTTKELSLHVLEHTKTESKDDIPKELTNRQAPKTQYTGFSRQELLQDYVNIAVELDGKATYTCKLCPNKVFARQVSIRNHMRIHENPTYKERSCHICHKTFLRRDTLLVHLRVHSDERKYKCDVCDASFTHSSSLVSHKRIHTGEKPYVCTICSKAFRESGQLAAHKKTHFEKLLQCPKCDKKFTTNKTLRGHCRTHTDERPYACSYCAKTFRSSTGLTTHLRVHTGEKPYKCEICSYATKQSGYLRTHMRTHTGERPYKCSYCDKGFSERKRLVTHTRSHTGERPYKCIYCDSAFARTDNLKYHLRTHTGERPFECVDCGKRFTQRTALIVHQKIHTDEKPYSCPHCDMNFRQSGTLVTHLLMHSNERPFKCDLCEMGFRQRALLKRHVARVHGDGGIYLFRNAPIAFPWNFSPLSYGEFPWRPTMRQVTATSQNKQHPTSQQLLGLRMRKEKKLLGYSGGFPSKWGLYLQINAILGERQLSNVENLQEDSIMGSHHFITNFRKMAGDGELAQTEFSNFIKEENNTYNGCEWSGENNVDEADHINGFLMTENIIKQEPDSFIRFTLNDQEPDKDEVNSFLVKPEEHEQMDYFSCLICGERFLSTEDLSLHAAEHKSELYEHLPKKSSNHKAPPTQVPGLSRQKLLQDYVNISVKLDGEATYTCKLCPDKVFSQLASIRNHMKIHEKRTYKERSCHICLKVFFQRETLLAHLKVHNEEKKLKCDICEASFSDPNSLNAHKQGHSSDKFYVCSVCSKSFKEADELKEHRKIHTPETLLPCPKCDRKFASYKALRNHYSTHKEEHTTTEPTTAPTPVDDDEKPFKCQMCSYATTQSGYLRRHMRTHTGERPHKCSYCDKAFAERKRLVSHTRSHTGERPFKCTYCDASYARNDNLKYHLRTHTGERPFECDQCGKRFIQRAALTGHQKIHTDEKPYCCPHCEMSFRHSGTLATHLLIHTNERPFKCDICEKGFTQKALLKRHVNREHENGQGADTI